MAMSSNFFESPSIQNSDETIEASQSRDERGNWGGANMRVVRGGHFWQLGSFV